MRDELDKQLCEKYPKIFKNRFADMRTTAMCWGFECGDGWYNILDRMCALMQWHIDQNRKERVRNYLHNRKIRELIKDPKKIRAYAEKQYATYHESYREEYVNRLMLELEVEPLKQMKKIPYKCGQIVASQVKEKFGTLRFYYDGGDVGDGYFRGVEAMAEAMSSVTCEECGAPGQLRGGGWIRCLCDTHATKDGETRITLDEEGQP